MNPQETPKDAAQSATDELMEAKACQNCGSPLYGEHCYACGQPTRGLVRHFSSIVGDIADTLFNIDGRIVRTLPALLFKPGFLSREYFDGHRVRYVSPVRLFVFLCIGTFFAAKLATPSLQFDTDGSGSITINSGASTVATFDSDERSAARAEPLTHQPSASNGAAARPEFPETAAKFQFNDTPWNAENNPIAIGFLPQAANDWLNAQVGHVPKNWQRVREDPDLLRNAFYSALPTALFVLVPAFAVFLKLLYSYKRRLYMEHLVSALHGHAFVCLMLLVLMVLTALERGLGEPAWLSAPLAWLEWLCALWVPVYLWLHLKRVYGQGVVLTTLKFLLLGIVELFLLSIVGIGAMVAAVVWL